MLATLVDSLAARSTCLIPWVPRRAELQLAPPSAWPMS
jgi:hypothetical protein